MIRIREKCIFQEKPTNVYSTDFHCIDSIFTKQATFPKLKKPKSVHESFESCTHIFLCANKHTLEMRLNKKNTLKMKSKIRCIVHETENTKKKP